MANLLVYLPQHGQRCFYAVKLILEEVLKIPDVHYSFHADDIREFKGAKIQYGGEEPISDELFIASSGLLFEKGLKNQEINIFYWRSIPAFFATQPHHELPFDIFSAAFFLATRYEEYLPHMRDEHDRFDHTQSLAYSHGFLQQPVINQWAKQLKLILKHKFPQIRFNTSKFESLSTVDIDIAYSYKGKGLIRNIGGGLKNISRSQYREFINRILVLLSLRKDPYDTYQLIIETNKHAHHPLLFFFHLGDYGPYDKGLQVECSVHYQRLIRNLADSASTGIHPSYRSNKENSQLELEINRLKDLLHNDVKKSRQHFLKLKFPETYRNLISRGIREDYTMGYAGETGFRASLCTPFTFYDIELEQSTPLKILPFAVMDGTLKDYLRLSPEEGWDRVQSLMEEVKRVDGTFISIWHNQSLCPLDGWENWGGFYEKMIHYAHSLKT